MTTLEICLPFSHHPQLYFLIHDPDYSNVTLQKTPQPAKNYEWWKEHWLPVSALALSGPRKVTEWFWDCISENACFASTPGLLLEHLNKYTESHKTPSNSVNK